MTYNAADEQQVKDADKKAKNEHDMLMSDYDEILKTYAGMRVFKHILLKGKLFHSTFTGNSTMYFKEGRKDIIYEIIKEISEASPGKLPRLIFEDKNDD